VYGIEKRTPREKGFGGAKSGPVNVPKDNQPSNGEEENCGKGKNSEKQTTFLGGGKGFWSHRKSPFDPIKTGKNDCAEKSKG